MNTLPVPHRTQRPRPCVEVWSPHVCCGTRQVDVRRARRRERGGLERWTSGGERSIVQPGNRTWHRLGLLCSGGIGASDRCGVLQQRRNETRGKDMPIRRGEEYL